MKHTFCVFERAAPAFCGSFSFLILFYLVIWGVFVAHSVRDVPPFLISGVLTRFVCSRLRHLLCFISNTLAQLLSCLVTLR